MQITQSGQQTATPQKASVAAIKAWAAGQLLKAVVTQINSQQATMSLRVQNIQIQLPIPSAQLNLKQGQQLQLEVVKDGAKPQVKIISTTTAGAAVTSPKPITITDAKIVANTAISAKTPAAILPSPSQATASSNAPQIQAQPAKNAANPSPANINLKPTATAKNQATNIQPQALTIKEKQILQQSQRSDLPKQMPLPALLANLNAINQPGSRSLQLNLPPQLVNFIRTTLASLSSRQEISTPAGLMKALKNSGLFLENKLLNNDPTVKQDVKGLFLRLAQQIQQLPESKFSAPPSETSPAKVSDNIAKPQTTTTPYTQTTSKPEIQLQPNRTEQAQVQSNPPASVNNFKSAEQAVMEIAKQVESSLSRIQLNQTSTLVQDDQAKTAFNFEIPIRHNNQSQLVNICIKRENEGDSPQGKIAPWSVSLALDLEKLGPVRILLTLFGKKISTTFWSEDPKTTKIFEHNLEQLKENMDEAGLDIGNMHCHTGTAPSPSKQNETIQLDNILLDEKA